MSPSVRPTPPSGHDRLARLARTLLDSGKGLLAIDESIPTCNRRFQAHGIVQDAVTRRDYREPILTTPGLSDSVSGVILCDETFGQRAGDGRLLREVATASGMIPGITVGRGTEPMRSHPDEQLTQGLIGLGARLTRYAALGARFAKWRAVFTIGPALPSQACLEENAHALARYAVQCQHSGLLPIVEPEVLLHGDHSLARCSEVTEQVQQVFFAQLHEHHVALEAMLLKPNMVLPGSSCPTQDPVETVAAATLACLECAVPAAVAGITFLSGGQRADLARSWLAALDDPTHEQPPWPLSFCFGRALEHPALGRWSGQVGNTPGAPDALMRRAEGCRAARAGRDEAFDPVTAHDEVRQARAHAQTSEGSDR